MIKIESIKRFKNRYTGKGLAVAITLGGNSLKLKQSLAPQFLSLSIIPEKRFLGSGSKELNEQVVCSKDCDHFNVKALNKPFEPCYVVQFRTIGSFYKRGSEELKDSKELTVFNGMYHLRISQFGDIGVLDDQGLDYVYQLVMNSKTVLGYSADWRHEHLQAFKPFVLASITSESSQIEAHKLGFNVYDSDKRRSFKESALVSKSLGFTMVKCMVSGSSKEPLKTLEFNRGCSTCKTPCGSSGFSVKSPDAKALLKSAEMRLQHV